MNSIVKLVYRWNRGSLATPDFFCTPFVVTAEEVLYNAVKYGYLYNWFTVDDARNIANTGWSVPTKQSFIDLRIYLDVAGTDNINIAGGKLKETGLTYWLNPNTGATNEVGFNARGTGSRAVDGTFFWLNKTCIFFTTESLDLDNAFSTELREDSDTFNTNNVTYYKNGGTTIRFIKDTTSLTHGQTGTYTGNDGKVYRTICIGTQEWLADNLVETLYRDLSAIPEVTDNATWAGLSTGARCSYDNDENNAI